MLLIYLRYLIILKSNLYIKCTNLVPDCTFLFKDKRCYIWLKYLVTVIWKKSAFWLILMNLIQEQKRAFLVEFKWCNEKSSSEYRVTKYEYRVNKFEYQLATWEYKAVNKLIIYTRLQNVYASFAFRVPNTHQWHSNQKR